MPAKCAKCWHHIFQNNVIFLLEKIQTIWFHVSNQYESSTDIMMNPLKNEWYLVISDHGNPKLPINSLFKITHGNP